jgi:hypothetical protein
MRSLPALLLALVTFTSQARGHFVFSAEELNAPRQESGLPAQNSHVKRVAVIGAPTHPAITID